MDALKARQTNDVLRVVRLVEGTTTPEIRLMTGDVRSVLSALQEAQGRLVDMRNTANALRDRADLAERTARNWNERYRYADADLDACRTERIELKLESVESAQQLAQAQAALAAAYAAIPRGAIRDFAESGVAAKMRYSQRLILDWLVTLPPEVQP